MASFVQTQRLLHDSLFKKLKSALDGIFEVVSPLNSIAGLEQEHPLKKRHVVQDLALSEIGPND